MTLRRGSLIAALLASSCAQAPPAAPKESALSSWFLSGLRQQDFRIAADGVVKRSGSFSARLGSDVKTTGAGTLMQSISATAYRGKRVRFSAYVRTEDVAGWAGLWMRVDRPGMRSAFDNMQERPLRGTGEWTPVSVVLDVKEGATAIHFGLLQDGAGTSWIDDASFTVVDASVPVTDLDHRPRALENGDLERPGVTGFQIGGSARDDFEMVLDKEVHHGGTASLKVVPKVEEPRGWVDATQEISAVDLTGKRVRVAVWLRGRDVARGGGFFAITYGAHSPPMSSGLTSGGCADLGPNFDWVRCETVIDVPATADSLTLRGHLEGKGTLWLDDLSVEEVSREVPLSGPLWQPRKLANPDFEAPALKGWGISGGGRAHYDVKLDRAERHGGAASARFEPRVSAPKGYGTLMQVLSAEPYRGQRVRMRAFVKGKGIDGRADLWLRVQGLDAPADGPGLGGGHERFSASFDWKPCTVVFDVPDDGKEIQMGVGLDAHGTLWLDDVSLEAVPDSVPLTHPRGRAPASLSDGTFDSVTEMPRGWFLSGGARTDFRAQADTTEKLGGTASMRLEPRVEAPGGYGTLMTAIDATSYRGKRMRMTAHVRGQGVSGRADAWLRVQSATSPGDGPGLGGGGCSYSGDAAWSPCTIVFEVPEGSDQIQFGIGLGAKGTLWLDDVTLDEVPRDTPLNSIVHTRSTPENLTFDE